MANTPEEIDALAALTSPVAHTSGSKPVAAFIMDPNGLGGSLRDGYGIKRSGGSDKAFAPAYAAIGRGFGLDDIALSTANGARLLGEALREHVQTNGPDDLIIAQHGNEGSVAGEMNNPYIDDLRYAALFPEIPQGIESIFIRACSSGSALQHVNDLHAGTMVFTSTGNSLGYGNKEVNRALESQTDGQDIDPIMLFKTNLVSADFVSQRDWTKEYNEKHGTQYSTDLADKVPYQFGISGHGENGIVDLRDYFKRFEGNRELIDQTIANLADSTGLNPDELAGAAYVLEAGVSDTHPEIWGDASAIAMQYLQDSGELERLIAEAREQDALAITPEVEEMLERYRELEESFPLPPQPAEPTSPKMLTPEFLKALKHYRQGGGMSPGGEPEPDPNAESRVLPYYPGQDQSRSVTLPQIGEPDGEAVYLANTDPSELYAITKKLSGEISGPEAPEMDETSMPAPADTPNAQAAGIRQKTGKQIS